MTQTETWQVRPDRGPASAGELMAVELQLAAAVEDVQLNLHQAVPETRIRSFVVRAYLDLLGSVDFEALPEMAGRLAAERLRGGCLAPSNLPGTAGDRTREGTRT